MKNQDMNEKMREHHQEQVSHNKFNSVTQSTKPENQNQQHNVRQEGTGPINQNK